MKNELNRKYNKDKQPSRSLLYSNVLHKITRFLHIYVTINDLSTYYTWMSHFPALEVKTQVVFIEDPSRDQLMTMAQQFLKNRNVDEDLISDNSLAR